MSETMGECERSVIVASDGPCHPHGERRAIASAIDRLAADVAAVLAKVDAVAPEDVRHFVESEKAWVAHVTEQRDAAIRKRDEWKEEARLAVVNRDEARAEVARLRGEVEDSDRLIDQLIVGNAELARQRDEARAEVERLKAELAAPQPAGQGISPGLPETQPAQNAAPPAGWLTEREQHALRHILAADVEPAIRSILARAGSPPSQTAPWWLTEEERAEIMHLLLIQRHNTGWTTERHAELNRLLARAGSPPVVEVPPMQSWEYTAHEEALAYRAAMDKAGVKWKEVGRE